MQEHLLYEIDRYLQLGVKMNTRILRNMEFEFAKKVDFMPLVLPRIYLPLTSFFGPRWIQASVDIKKIGVRKQSDKFPFHAKNQEVLDYDVAHHLG